MVELAAKNARVGMNIALDAAMDAAMDAPPLAPAEPAIDQAHLARMTHGERDLEREVLQLYATQADILLARMLPGDQSGDQSQSQSAAVAALAHTLNGSSRGIGAWQVADAAAAVEADATKGRDTAVSVRRLASAVRAAQAHIVELMRG